MPFMEWKETFNTGVQQFDEHHRHLVGLLNAFYEVFDEGGTKEKLRKLFDELLDYATYHFNAEEQWMERNHFPKFAEHAEEHASFGQTVVELDKDFVAGSNKTLETIVFLKGWLAEHILGSDAEFGLFALKNNLGMRSPLRHA